MSRNELYIFNQFIHNIYMRYKDDDMINGLPIISHRKINTLIYGVEYELVRVEINCAIDELKDIIGTIKNKKIRFQNNDEELIANIYLTNNNEDIQALTILFDINVFLVIDIYRPDYKKLKWNREDELFKILIIDLSKHNII